MFSRIGWMLLSLLIPIVGACTARVTPPTVPASAGVTAYLWESGSHSGIVLPTHDGHGVSFEYGEWAWVIERRRGWWRLGAVLFTGTPAYLMRDRVPHVDDPLVVAIATEADRVWAFAVERELADRLRWCLENAFDRGRDQAMLFDGRLAVPAAEPYHLGRTCSRITGIWLRRLGCDLAHEAWVWNWEVRGVEALDIADFVIPEEELDTESTEKHGDHGVQVEQEAIIGPSDEISGRNEP